MSLHARETDPDTSHAAGASLDAVKLSELQADVLDVIRAFGTEGCTMDDVLKLFPGAYGTVTPRFRDLIKKGLVVDTGERRRAKSGRSQRVMRAVA